MQVANSLDVPNKAAYLGSLAILGNLVYDSQTIQDILEEIMQHAPIVEHMAPLAHEQGKAEGIEQGKAEGIEQGKAEGIEQGETRAKRDSVIKLLTHQFPDVSDALVESIHEIEERSRLDMLFDQILSATSFEDIDLNGVGSQGK